VLFTQLTFSSIILVLPNNNCEKHFIANKNDFNKKGGITLISIKAGSATELVYNYLKNEIIHQKLKPGTQLTEQSFCDKLGVGHSPVRRAFEALQEEGYVEISPNKGAFVAEFTKLQIMQLCAFRIELQTYALSLCIDLFTDDDFIKLEGYINDEISAFETLDFAQYMDAILGFHCHIVDKAKNPYLSAAFNNVINRVSVYLALYDNFYDVHKPISFNNHSNLIQAIQNKKLKQAKKILEKISNNMIQVFEFNASNPK